MQVQKTQKQKSTPVRYAQLWIRHPALVVAAVFVCGTVIAWIVVLRWTHATVQAWSLFSPFSSSTPAVTQDAAQDTAQDAVTNNPTSFPRLLDGVETKPAEAQRWPVAVMIENLPSVRPQAGLSDASVVYETLAEGGSTRFMALFDPQALTTKKIGPVRSSRAYYLEWLGEYDALYAHAGGSPKALTVIREASVKNLEALSRDGVYFWRDSSRSAPHNLYTSAEKLTIALRDKELLTESASFAPWTFVDEAESSARGTDAKKLRFNFSSGKSYEVEWVYSRLSNEYLRFNAGLPHTDENNGAQLEAKNVIVQLVEEPKLDGTGKGRLDMYVGGTGDAWVAHNGEMIKATWKKESRTDRTRFYDPEGKEIPLVRGATWIHVVPKSHEVTYE